MESTLDMFQMLLVSLEVSQFSPAFYGSFCFSEVRCEVIEMIMIFLISMHKIMQLDVNQMKLDEPKWD